MLPKVGAGGTRNAKGRRGGDNQNTTAAAQQVLQSSQLSISPMPVGPPLPATTAPAPTPPNLAAEPSNAAANFSPPFVGSGGVLGTIGQYFASHAAPVSTSTAGDVTLTIGAKVPGDVTLYPLPYDLFNELQNGNYVYFVSGGDVVVVDQNTDVVDAIIPNSG
jgi:hypothetical protein